VQEQEIWAAYGHSDGRERAYGTRGRARHGEGLVYYDLDWDSFNHMSAPL